MLTVRNLLDIDEVHENCDQNNEDYSKVLILIYSIYVRSINLFFWLFFIIKRFKIEIKRMCVVLYVP